MDLTAEEMGRGGGGGRTRQRHHIASIAHHFLDAPADLPSPAPARRIINVAGKGHGHLIAWVCAGLVRGSGRPGVVLAESGHLDWSATSHLPGPDLLEWPAGTARPQAARDLECWLWAGTGNRTGPHPDGETVFRNLGSLNNHQLDRLEAARLDPGRGKREVASQEALVWCLAPHQAVSLGSAYTLGRVLSLLNPGTLEIVVVAESCLNPPRRQNVALDSSILARSRQTLDPMVQERAARYHLVCPAQSGQGESPTAILTGLGRRLVGGDDSD